MLGIDATFDHVAHAATSIRAMLPVYRDLLGGEFVGGGDNPRVGFRTIQLRFKGGGRVELLEPLAGSTFLDSFLARNGNGGLHHLTFKVPDILAAIESAERNGLAPFGVHLGNPIWQEAFLHPKRAHGALIQIAQSSFDTSAPMDPPRVTLEEFLDAGGGYFGP
jgi:methylmalonyl-CoA/ethylmalonyl-CoA epimerase